MRAFLALFAALAIVAGSAVVAEAAIPQDGPQSVPAVFVTVAPHCTTPVISGRTASAYCTTMPVGGWAYLLITFRNKAGATGAAYSPRVYRPWLNMTVAVGYPYWITSAQVIHSS
jgi:hypothetical protein